MQRTYLKPNDTLELNGKIFTIASVIGDGATCIVYSATYKDNLGFSHDVNIKECYPYNTNVIRNGNDLVWSSDEEKKAHLNSFKTTYEKLFMWQDANEVVGVFDLCAANNTQYIIMEPNKNCVTFDKDQPESLSDILKTVKLLTHYVGKYHKNGYLHLDIKPNNFLVFPRPSEHIVLFDFDTVASIEDIKSGKYKYTSYSEAWAAPEQKQGKISKLCPATDIYAIGAVLFEKIIGRQVNNDDIGYFAEWDFDSKLFENTNPKIKRLLRTIFRKTLSANIKRRYQDADELISALEESIKVAEQKTYLISDYIVSDINFVGRKNDLLKLDELFENGTKAVFLHGFGGVGKTALATKYAELYANKYDCVKFCRYSNGLKQIIDSLEIANASTNNSDEHRKLLKTVLEDTRTLIIIDNFDVEDDEELEYLLSLNCNVLFTTRNDYSQYISSEKIEIIELESLPTDALVQVFKNEYGRDITENEKELVEDIIEKFGNLTLIVPMIAKQILSSHISIEEFASSIEDDVFARFNEDNEDIRISKDGKCHKINSLDYLRAMFNIAALSEVEKTVLQYLYLLRYHNDLALTTEKYKKYTNTNNLNALNDLAFKNWITIERDTFRNEDNIVVHQLIYDLVEKDFYPTYDSVPGITKYIENCFKTLEDMMVPKQSIGETVIDWESAKCITFALLMYVDIYSSENKETHSKKAGVLYSFMCIAFLEDAHKLHKLLFTSPEESAYYFFTHGIMNMFHFDIVENINRWSDWIKLLKNQNKESENLYYNINNGYVEFENQDEKKQFIDYIKTDAGLEYENVFSNQVLVVSYFVMLLYFANINGDTAVYNNTIDLIMKVEEILQESSSLNNDIFEQNRSNKEDLNVRLNYYLAICNDPDYNNNAERTHNHGLDIAYCYDYYAFALSVLQYALSSVTDSTLQENYVKEGEKLIIMLEEQNEHFVWYGLSKEDVLSYTLPSNINLQKNKKLHWSKRADNWYASVEKTLASAKEPYAIYKLLLNFDYQTKVLSNAKINKLLKSKFIDMIYNDDRLSAEQKSELLIDNVVSQIHSIKVSRKKTTTFVKKHTPKLQLFFDAISKSVQLMPELKNNILSGQIVLLLDFMLILQKLLKKEVFDIKEYIEKCITINNINYVGELIYFADKIRLAGHIKKSQYLKSIILDLCFEANFETLPEDIIQMLLFKVIPLAIKFGRTDLVDKIDAIPHTIERQYHLELLFSRHLITCSEPTSIACNFMDDYINMVATEAYYKLHDVYVLQNIDDTTNEMEKLLSKYLEELLQATDEEKSYYRNIFDYPYVDDWHRSLHPFWAREFHGTQNKEVNIGLCYLIAQYCEDIPFKSKAIKESLKYLTNEESYDITMEELQTVLDNIKRIYPPFKNY